MASIIAKIVGDQTGFDKTVAGVQGKVKTMEKAFKSFFGLLAGGAVGAWSKRMIEMGDHIATTSKKLGVSTEFLQEFTYAADQNGVSVNNAETALQRFTRRLGEAAKGKGELLPILSEYNIAITDSAGRTRTAHDVMADLADVIARTIDPNERLRIAMKAFDTEGVVMVNMLSQGSAAMEKMYRSAGALGQVIDDDTIQSLARLNSRISTITGALRTMGVEGLNFVISAVEKYATVSERIFGGTKTEAEIVADSFDEAAERIIRASEKIVKQTNGAMGFSVSTEFVQTVSGLVPLQKVIADKAAEMAASAKSAQTAYEATVASGREKVALQQEEAVKAAELAQINRTILDIVRQGGLALAQEHLPAQERLKAINMEMVDQARLLNDETLPRPAREEAAKRIVALMKEQRSAAEEIQKETAEIAEEDAKRLATLQAQKQSTLDQIANIKAQGAAWKEAQLAATFQSIASGAGTNSQQSTVAQIQELEALLAAQQLRGSPQGSIDSVQAQLDRQREIFESKVPEGALAANPFKTALSETEDSLEDIEGLLQNL